MYRELTIASSVSNAKLKRALKQGKLSLSAVEFNGTGAVLHLHPGSYDKALKARKWGKGVRLEITRVVEWPRMRAERRRLMAIDAVTGIGNVRQSDGTRSRV